MEHPSSQSPISNEEALKQVWALRQKIRHNQFESMTSGLASGMVQGNLVILPKDDADEFEMFCKLNPKPCPLVGLSKPGDPSIPELGNNIDIRTDIPRYLVYQNGKMTDEVSDIQSLWREDFVAFILGCSYSFEGALVRSGVTPRNVSEGKNVSMYRTSIKVEPSGKFQGYMVVSMRPYLPEDAIEAIVITARFSRTHGAPIHFGNPADIGIADITQPDFGDAVEIKSGEVPVFWACGVTPQLVLEQTKPEFCITHKPGYMLITDRFDHEFED